MSVYGLIYCAYNAEDYLSRSLGPWLEARQARIGGHEIIICAVNCRFQGFEEGLMDATHERLREHMITGGGAHIIHSSTPIAETEARGQALQWLVRRGVDATIQWDSDEFATVDQLARILAFIEARPQITWFRLSYRNRVFTPDQYLVEPFTPSRIHRVVPPGHKGYRAHSFWDDNNVLYGGTITRDLIRDVEFSSMVVPKNLVWIDHWTWLSNERSRLKCEYQQRRWGGSSFKWNDNLKRLEWNEEYYVSHGLSFPPETRSD